MWMWINLFVHKRSCLLRKWYESHSDHFILTVVFRECHFCCAAFPTTPKNTIHKSEHCATITHPLPLCDISVKALKPAVGGVDLGCCDPLLQSTSISVIYGRAWSQQLASRAIAQPLVTRTCETVHVPTPDLNKAHRTTDEHTAAGTLVSWLLSRHSCASLWTHFIQTLWHSEFHDFRDSYREIKN
jgi:hypothetical protein